MAVESTAGCHFTFPLGQRRMWRNQDPPAGWWGWCNSEASVENMTALPNVEKRDPAAQHFYFLGIYSRGLRTQIHTKNCTSVLTVVSFAIGEQYKQLNYLSTYEQINQWNIHILEYYSTIRRNEVSKSTVRLENVMIREQSHKRILLMCDV